MFRAMKVGFQMDSLRKAIDTTILATRAGEVSGVETVPLKLHHPMASKIKS